MPLAETAFAKINLALHVRARGADGFHELETIFVFADDGDHLTVESAEGLSLSIEGPLGGELETGHDNLVMQAARAMQAHFGVEKGAAIRLTKNLPVAAGLGGGSADAAAAARALAHLWELPARESDIVAAIGHLGADVPACVGSRTIRGEGRGERFYPVDAIALSGLPLLIANPGCPLATRDVFAVWNGEDLGALPEGEPMHAARAGRNDLEPGAIGLCPPIAEGLATLHGHGEMLCRMSGSGASIFAVYPDEAARDRAHRDFAGRLPDWWTLAARLR